ncbi:MAG: hypothetical protein Q9167_004617 [Letrouitia subvulpina]
MNQQGNFESLALNERLSLHKAKQRIKTMAEENANAYPAPNADDLSSVNKDGEFLQPPPTMDSPAPPLTNIHADIYNAEAAPSPVPIQPSASIPAMARTATPTRNTNGNIELPPPPIPTKAAPHGAPARRYLNEKVTGVLLEGMKRLAAEQ